MANTAPHGPDGPLTVPAAVDAMVRHLRRQLDERRGPAPSPSSDAPGIPLAEIVERARVGRLEQRSEAEALAIRQGAEVAAARIIADALAGADALVAETEAGVAQVWAETRSAIDEQAAGVAKKIADADALMERATKDADELRAAAARYLTDVRRRADDELRKEVEQARRAVYAEVADVLARASDRSRVQAGRIPVAVLQPPDPPPPAGAAVGAPGDPLPTVPPARPLDTTLLHEQSARLVPSAPGPLGGVSVRPLETEPEAADDLLQAGEVRIERSPPLPGSRPLELASVSAGPEQQRRGIGHWLRRRRPEHGSHRPG